MVKRLNKQQWREAFERCFGTFELGCFEDTTNLISIHATEDNFVTMKGYHIEPDAETGETVEEKNEKNMFSLSDSSPVAFFTRFDDATWFGPLTVGRHTVVKKNQIVFDFKFRGSLITIDDLCNTTPETAPDIVGPAGIEGGMENAQ